MWYLHDLYPGAAPHVRILRDAQHSVQVAHGHGSPPPLAAVYLRIPRLLTSGRRMWNSTVTPSWAPSLCRAVSMVPQGTRVVKFRPV